MLGNMAGECNAAQPQVASITKAVDILGAVANSESALSIRQIAATLGYPRSTVHGICRTLVAHGLLGRGPDHGYEAGPGLFELGGSFVDRAGLLRASRGALDLIPRMAGVEVHIGQLVGGWIYYIAHRSHPPLTVPALTAFRAPVHRAGCGLAALSALEEQEIWPRIDRFGVSSAPAARAALLKHLQQARRHGVSISTWPQPDRTSVAAPILDTAELPIGAVSISGRSTLFSNHVLDQVSSIVRVTAGRIETSLLRMRGTYEDRIG